MKYMNIETLQEVYAFHFFRVYREFPKTKHLELNKKYLLSKIEYLRKLKQPLL